MVPVMKFKTYGKDASQFDEAKVYWCSVKYDGHCIKIVQDGETTRWFTSNDKEFDLGVPMPNGKYVAFAEFMYGCEGKLGDRTKSAILTTLRTNFAKGLTTKLDYTKINIRVFDLAGSRPYAERWDEGFRLGLPMATQYFMTGEKALQFASELAKDGWEGLMLRDPSKPHEPGKRVHHSIKVKFKKTADLLCIGVEEGEGKCEGIGALVLQDSKGRVVRVGSGLTYDTQTRQSPEMYLGKVVEISYEQIMDTYVQPVFVAVREDKTKEEID